MNHPNEFVQQAIQRLLQILDACKNVDGREYVLIIRDSSGFSYHCLNGKEVPKDVRDEVLLNAVTKEIP